MIQKLYLQRNEYRTKMLVSISIILCVDPSLHANFSDTAYSLIKIVSAVALEEIQFQQCCFKVVVEEAM